MRLAYNEDTAQLTVEVAGQRWRYKDVPLSMYKKINKLNNMGFDGSVWQLIKRYEVIDRRNREKI